MGALAWFSFLVSFLTLVMAWRNLKVLLAPDPRGCVEGRPLLSVLIPARNEQARLPDCLSSVCASDYPQLEVLVYDDQSEDETAAVVSRWSARDPRVRGLSSRPLPVGWNGKQHACWELADRARGDYYLFLDADVRVEPDCLRRALSFAQERQAGLVSTFPRQQIGSLGEALLVSLIPFVLLSYLPLARMRSTREPATSAGCGQFLLVRRDAYQAAGGHAGFASRSHDGLHLTRAVRAAGFATDLFEGSALARVRMYEGFRQTWQGFAKNSYEALGSTGLLLFVSFLHLGGQLGGWLCLPHPIACAAVGCQLVQRTLLARRFRQPLWTVLLHPFSLLAWTAVQWWSRALTDRGRLEWRGRVLPRAAFFPAPAPVPVEALV